MKTDILALHNEAMDLSFFADIERKKGNIDKAQTMYAEAYEKEIQVLPLLTEENSNDIGRIILLRSAASLAVLCGKTREAERLIARGLSEDIPEFLAEQFRDLMKEIYTPNSEDSQEVCEDSQEVCEAHKEVCEITLPNSDKTFLSSLITRMGWTANFRKVAVL